MGSCVMKMTDLTSKKRVVVGLTATAACGVVAQALRVWVPGILDLVYPCLVIFSVIVSVARARHSIRGDRSGKEEFSALLAWLTAMTALFCVVSGDLYASGFQSLFPLEGASLCLVASASAGLSLVVSLAARYFKADSEEGARAEVTSRLANPSTAVCAEGGQPEGVDSNEAQAADSTTGIPPEQANPGGSTKFDKVFVVVAAVIGTLPFAAIFAWSMSGPEAWQVDQNLAMTLVKTALLSLLGAVSMIVSLGVAILLVIMAFRVMSGLASGSLNANGGLNAASFLICLLVLLVACVYFRDYDLERLLERFGGYDAIAPFVACVLVAGFLAVLYNIVSFIIEKAVASMHRLTMKSGSDTASPRFRTL